MRKSKVKDITTIKNDIKTAYVSAPKENASEKVNKDVIVDIKGCKIMKIKDKEFIYIKCTYVVGSKWISQEGWVENNLETFSAYDWSKFGFKVLDGGSDYLYDLNSKNSGNFALKHMWKQFDIKKKDGIIDSDELNMIYSILESQQVVSKIVCKHKLEWSYEPDAVVQQVEKFFDDQIALKPSEQQNDLKNIKKEKLNTIKEQAEKTMFWRELTSASYTPQTTDSDKEYETKKKEIDTKYNTVSDDESDGTKEKKQSELNALDKKYKKGDYAPKDRTIPNADNVYSFHPIAFVEQMKLITGGKTGECLCNKDFTAEDLRAIVKRIRDNTFDKTSKKSIYYHHQDRIFHDSDVPKSDQTYDRFAEVLNNAFNKYNINTCIHKIHFLAQMYIETQFFTKLKEGGTNLHYDPYRGRGFMQLTWEKNYKAYSNTKGNENIVNDYNKVSKNLDLAADTAVWYWKNSGIEKYVSQDSIFGVSKTINYPAAKRANQINHFRERKIAWIKVKEIFNYPYNCVTDASKHEAPVYGEGVLEEMRKWADNHIQYDQQLGKKFRSVMTQEAMEKMDCSEFVCRYLHKLGVTDKVKLINTDKMINQEKFREALGNDNIIHVSGSEKSEFIPQAGDIFVWSRGEGDGHTGIVHSYDSNKDAVTILEEIGRNGSSDENFNENNGGYIGHNCSRTSVYQRTGGALAGHKGWKGYFRPLNYTKKL